MRAKWAIYYTITILISLLLYYYIAVFCGIYVNNSIALIQTSLISLFIDWIIIGFGVPIMIAIIRHIIKNCPSLRYI